MIVLGLMSGTSLDGLDLALVEFPQGNNTQFNLLNYKTVALPHNLKTLLQNPFQLTALAITKLDWDFARFCADEVNNFLEKIPITPDFISSHGQTVFHQPPSFTLQIGNGAILASLTGLPVVSDFRSANVALKGEGAPLVPIADELLFNQFDSRVNIGGFSNISFTEQGDTLQAYDICPANSILNPLAEELGTPFDRNGEFAKKGEINAALLSQLNSIEHYHTTNAKKSLGTEWNTSHVWPVLNQSQISVYDKLRTYTEHIAIQLAKAIHGNSCLLSGGGAFNTFLVNRIRLHSEANVVILSPDITDFKEAIIFAYLGYLRWTKQENILQSYTGSIRNHCAGSIHLP